MKWIYYLMYIVCILSIITLAVAGNYPAAIWAFNSGLWVLDSHIEHNTAETWRQRCLEKDNDE